MYCIILLQYYWIRQSACKSEAFLYKSGWPQNKQNETVKVIQPKTNLNLVVIDSAYANRQPLFRIG